MSTLLRQLAREQTAAWADNLPQSWDLVRLRRLLRDIGQGWSPRAKSRTAADDEWGVLKLSAVNKGRFHPDENKALPSGEDPRPKYEIHSGDLLITRANTPDLVGDACYVRNTRPRLMISDLIYRLKTQDHHLGKRYLCYYLISTAGRSQIKPSARGSSQSMVKISQRRIGAWLVPVPPRTTQDKIAEFLDGKTAHIDELIKDKKRLIERLKEKRQTLIDHAVSGGLFHTDERQKPTASWLPALPSEWDTTRIKHIAKPRPGAFTDGDWVESPYITDSGVRLIQTGNIGVGQYREQGFRYISGSSFDELSCTEVQPGDILICRLAEPVGRACQAPDLGERMITAVDVAILKPRPKHDPRFLVYFFSSTPYLKWVERISRGGTRDRISRSMLGNVQVPTPPPEEQTRIADHLDNECGKIDDVVEGLEQQIARLHEYRTSLITTAVTGQIDVDSYTSVAA